MKTYGPSIITSIAILALAWAVYTNNPAFPETVEHNCCPGHSVDTIFVLDETPETPPVVDAEGFITITRGVPVDLTQFGITYFKSHEFESKCPDVVTSRVSLKLMLLLQFLREHYNAVFKITSNGRSKPCNDAIPGAEFSQHLYDLAADGRFLLDGQRDHATTDRFRLDLREQGRTYHKLREMGLGAVGFYDSGLLHIDVRESETLVSWGLYDDAFLASHKCEL